MIGFGRFDAEAFRRRLMGYGDVDLIKMGKACVPSEWLIADPMTKLENAAKYDCVGLNGEDGIRRPHGE